MSKRYPKRKLSEADIRKWIDFDSEEENLCEFLGNNSSDEEFQLNKAVIDSSDSDIFSDTEKMITKKRKKNYKDPLPSKIGKKSVHEEKKTCS